MEDRRPIIVLDFGAQYSQLIARRVRECHVYSLILPYNVPTDRIESFHPQGLILSGGPASVHEQGSPQLDKSVFELGVPSGLAPPEWPMLQGNAKHDGRYLPEPDPLPLFASGVALLGLLHHRREARH